MQLVRCKLLDPALKARFDDIITLELDKAYRLKNAGKITILDEDKITKNVISKQYKTKIMLPEINYEIKTQFTDKKKYKIAWVQDNSKPNGGAEISNRGVIGVGETIGIDVAMVTPQIFSSDVLRDCDLMVLNNIFEFSEEQFKIILDYCFEKSKPYIKYDHDQREAKRNSSMQIFLRSKLNVFISPAHKNFIIRGLHLPIDNKNISLPLCINTELFIDKKTSRVEDSALIPTPHKCFSILVEYIKDNPAIQFTLISSRPTPHFDHFKNVKYITPVIQQEMVDLYNTHEYMVHLPDSFWAGERIYFEALLCGCTPIVNSHVGHKSWPDKDVEQLKDDLKKAPYIFWKKVKELL